jgi:DNA-binding NarL/FixJ family response regulator
MAVASGGYLFYTTLKPTSKTRNEVNLMRILLADGQAKVRFALRVLLEWQPGISVVGEAADAEDLLSQIATECPDLVLLAWELPGLVHFEALTSMRIACPDLLVLALSGRPEARRLALAAGADGFVSKSEPPEHLLSAIAALPRETS